jgi:hypothetical protein
MHASGARLSGAGPAGRAPDRRMVRGPASGEDLYAPPEGVRAAVEAGAAYRRGRDLADHVHETQQRPPLPSRDDEAGAGGAGGDSDDSYKFWAMGVDLPGGYGTDESDHATGVSGNIGDVGLDFTTPDQRRRARAVQHGYVIPKQQIEEEQYSRRMLGLRPMIKLSSRRGRDIPRPTIPEELVRVHPSVDLKKARKAEDKARAVFWGAYDDWQACRARLDVLEHTEHNQRRTWMRCAQHEIFKGCRAFLHARQAGAGGVGQGRGLDGMGGCAWVEPPERGPGGAGRVGETGSGGAGETGETEPDETGMAGPDGGETGETGEGGPGN